MEKINKVLFTVDQRSDFTDDQRCTAQYNIGLPVHTAAKEGCAITVTNTNKLGFTSRLAKLNRTMNNQAEGTAADDAAGCLMISQLFPWAESESNLIFTAEVFKIHASAAHASVNVSNYFDRIEFYTGTEDSPDSYQFAIWKFDSDFHNGYPCDSDKGRLFFSHYYGSYSYSVDRWTLKFVKKTGAPTLDGLHLECRTSVIEHSHL